MCYNNNNNIVIIFQCVPHKLSKLYRHYMYMYITVTDEIPYPILKSCKIIMMYHF